MSRKNKKKGIRYPAGYTPVEQPPLPVTQVRYDGALWTVDGAGCRPAFGSSGLRQSVVRRRTDTEYVLRPAVGSVLFWLLVTAFGSVFVAGFTVALFDGRLVRGTELDVAGALGGALAALVGAACMRAGLRTMTQTTRFDKPAGTMTHRTLFGTVRAVPLADVVAVQAIYAHRALAGGGRGLTAYDVLQVNLIVAVGDKKVNVVSEPDETYVRTLAADLAAFLGVPLVDQVAETRKHHGQ